MVGIQLRKQLTMALMIYTLRLCLVISQGLWQDYGFGCMHGMSNSNTIGKENELGHITICFLGPLVDNLTKSGKEMVYHPVTYDVV